MHPFVEVLHHLKRTLCNIRTQVCVTGKEIQENMQSPKQLTWYSPTQPGDVVSKPSVWIRTIRIMKTCSSQSLITHLFQWLCPSTGRSDHPTDPGRDSHPQDLNRKTKVDRTMSCHTQIQVQGYPIRSICKTITTDQLASLIDSLTNAVVNGN